MVTARSAEFVVSIIQEFWVGKPLRILGIFDLLRVINFN